MLAGSILERLSRVTEEEQKVLRVDKIAVSGGYENVSCFHRLFAARFGRSPKKYRDRK